MTYPALCTGCEKFMYETAKSGPCPNCFPASKWDAVREWLSTSESDWFHDEAVLGGLPEYEAEELLLDFGIPATRRNLRQLGHEIDASLMRGR